MATPTRSQPVSTPKNLTPSRANASPRTNLGAFGGKSIGKSPAVKTPASIQGHLHRTSVSSLPISTPLAASFLPDDILNMNTPAALIASMGTTGLTPLPTTHDGLGITTGLSSMPSLHDVPAIKNPEKERYDRLKSVADTLQRKTAGRGVTRDHLQKLAKIHGLNELYDKEEHLLTIAGQNFVELDIKFEGNTQDSVKDAALKINLVDSGEVIHQEHASRVLTENLIARQHESTPWYDLSAFSANLGYLSRLEHIDGGSNCFEIIENLYNTFQTIWTEENKRMKWRHDSHHLCHSNVGQPRRDVGGKLGLETTYWTSGRRSQALDESKAGNQSAPKDDWTAIFSIEGGPPAIQTVENWLMDDILSSTSARAEDIFQDVVVDKPAWQTPTAVTQQKSQQNTESTATEQDSSKSQTILNMHFICQLQPVVLLPLSAAQALNEQVQMVDLQSSQVISFQQSFGLDLERQSLDGDRWHRLQHVFDKDGRHSDQRHSYSCTTSHPVYLHPVDKLKFSHPQQYAEALPVFRQYALVNRLLQSIKPDHSAALMDPAPARVLPVRGHVTKRSNKSKTAKQLDDMLCSNQHRRSISSERPIDVIVDLISSPIKSCRLQVRLPFTPKTMQREEAQRSRAEIFLSVDFDVLLGGIVEVVHLAGVEAERGKLDDLLKRLAKTIRVSEDIGVTCEWLLRALEVL